MQNECEVYFALLGDDFDPESLSIGVAPTRFKKKSIPISRQASWVFSTGKISGDLIDVYKIASSVVTALEPYVGSILEVKQKYDLDAVFDVVLAVSPDDSTSTPELSFDSRVVSFINKVGASIDIDTYRKEG